jgi:hypothetical protein
LKTEPYINGLIKGNLYTQETLPLAIKNEYWESTLPHEKCSFITHLGVI